MIVCLALYETLGGVAIFVNPSIVYISGMIVCLALYETLGRVAIFVSPSVVYLV